MTARWMDSTALGGMETARSTSSASAPPANGVRLKVTAWRLLNTTLLLGFGIYKSYRSTLGVPTSDWIICLGWAVIAYWGMYVEAEAPALAPWLFIQDISKPTRFVLAEVITIAWFISAPVLAYLWALPSPTAKEANPTVSTYLWIISVASALLTPIQFWDRVNDSRIITWARRRWLPRQFHTDERSDFAGVFLLGKLIATLANVMHVVYNLYHFTRVSDLTPSVIYGWLITASISLFVPMAVCGIYIAVRRH
ncbi:hypothetical protein C8R45DRAFT_1042437 [Mycena sanguinolenta]|nr:hypothetical protein C8R45DRAFT_1042437 [Mycena sanguinolenta]